MVAAAARRTCENTAAGAPMDATQFLKPCGGDEEDGDNHNDHNIESISLFEIERAEMKIRVHGCLA
jgi:hypothetical protein